MKIGIMALCVLGFVAGNTISSIQFKWAADAVGKRALMWFVLGSITGMGGPLGLTFALKHGNPNVVYALCFGTAFAVLQIVSWKLFQQPLTKGQWLGVLLVGVGICLLQMGGRR